MSLPVRGLLLAWDLCTSEPCRISDDSHIKRFCALHHMRVYGALKEQHTACGLHVCPGCRAMSMVLSGRVMRNSSESTSVPSSSQTRDRDTADRDSSKAWQTYSTHTGRSGFMWSYSTFLFLYQMYFEVRVGVILTLSLSSSRVPAVMPFLVSLLWQHTLKGRCGGDHTRLVTDLRREMCQIT